MKCPYCGGDTFTYDKCALCEHEITTENLLSVVAKMKKQFDDGGFPSGEEGYAFLAELISICSDELQKRGNFECMHYAVKLCQVMATYCENKLKENPYADNVRETKENMEEYQRVMFSLCFLGASKNNVECMRLLVHFYGLGKGCEKDEVEALKWLRKAADAGDEFSKNALLELENEKKEKEDQSRVFWIIIYILVFFGVLIFSFASGS